MTILSCYNGKPGKVCAGLAVWSHVHLSLDAGLAVWSHVRLSRDAGLAV